MCLDTGEKKITSPPTHKKSIPLTTVWCSIIEKMYVYRQNERKKKHKFYTKIEWKTKNLFLSQVIKVSKVVVTRARTK